MAKQVRKKKGRPEGSGVGRATGNGEMKRLMMDYTFRFLDDSVIFLVEIDNIRSQKAMRKVGCHLTGRLVQRTLQGTFSEFVILSVESLSNVKETYRQQFLERIQADSKRP